MIENARFEPVLLRREQVSQENPPEKPWLRMKNEPAAWYMRFKRYLAAGAKRSLRALVVAESGTQVNTKEGKNLSDVSVPRPWRRASKVWHWVERAEQYDLALQEKHASFLRQTANECLYASRAFRIKELNVLASLLRDQITTGMELKDCLAITDRLRLLMRDISVEMQGLEGVTAIQCDAAALEQMIEHTEKKQEEERLKNASMHERNKAIFERYECEV